VCRAVPLCDASRTQFVQFTRYPLEENAEFKDQRPRGTVRWMPLHASHWVGSRVEILYVRAVCER